MTIAASIRTTVISELLADAQLRGGQVPSWKVASMAAGLNVAESTIWRWLRDEREADSRPARPARAFLEALTGEHIEVVIACGGHLKKAKRILDKAYPEIEAMSYATFRRRWTDVDPVVRALADDGLDGALSKQMRLRHEAASRNQVWHIDHQELPVWVFPSNSQTPMKPYLTTVLDDSTRRVMSVLLTMGRPASDAVVVAVADAIRRKRLPNGQAAGGLPAVLHSDNGAELRSKPVTGMLASLGIAPKRIMPYLKHLNGKVERFHRTMQEDLIADLPGYTNLPGFPGMDGQFGLGGEPALSEDALWVRICEWVDAYNQDHPHSELDGMTPNEKWCSQSAGLDFPSEDRLWEAMLTEARPRKVQPSGVHFQGRYYTHPDLARKHLIGREVTVRFFPQDTSFIEVFADGKRVCTAFPHASLTDEQRAEFQRVAREQLRDAKAFRRSAVRRREALVQADPNNAASLAEAARPEAVAADDTALLELMADDGEET